MVKAVTVCASGCVLNLVKGLFDHRRHRHRHRHYHHHRRRRRRRHHFRHHFKSSLSKFRIYNFSSLYISK